MKKQDGQETPVYIANWTMIERMNESICEKRLGDDENARSKKRVRYRIIE